MKTNEEAKQEAIKKAWKNTKIGTPPELNDLGECHYSKFNIDQQIGFNNEEFYSLQGYWQPKALKGIEDNNGWIRIEPDGSNLPETNPTKYKVYSDGSLPNLRVPHKNNDDLFTCISVRVLYSKRLITHYKPITPELKPIY